MKKKTIVFDCDNTFGMKGRDVDDGLALLYLLGHPCADLLGVTTTYGNSRTEAVYANTLKMVREIGREGLPVKRGGESPGDYKSEAVDFLVEMADSHEGELSVLATGALTNLGGAYEKDPHFFEKIKEIVLMGGITEPLLFEKGRMEELNFTCDREATFSVLTKGRNVSVITGNNCLKVLFTREEYRRELKKDTPIFSYIRERTDYWFDDNMDDYGIQGFYSWDVTAGVYLMEPGLFQDGRKRMEIRMEDLREGWLREAGEANCVLNLPEIREEKAFKQNIYEMWGRA